VFEVIFHSSVGSVQSIDFKLFGTLGG
jgi:hypothetical protein